LLREGATAASASNPNISIRGVVSDEQCKNYSQKNTVIDSSNLKDFISCLWPDAPAKINTASKLLSKIQTGPKSSYLPNTFSKDISNMSLAISNNSSLIGKTWSVATVEINMIKQIIETDLNFLSFLAEGNEFSLPDYSQGTNIPPYIKEQIDSNTCSPLIDPSFSYTQLQNLNQALKQQQNTLADLEKKILDIKNRYPIQFNIGTVSVDTSKTPVPKISISGNIPNPVINFTLITPQDGPQGPPGPHGPQGSKGSPALPGSKGLDGYWGTDFLYQKIFDYA